MLFKRDSVLIIFKMLSIFTMIILLSLFLYSFKPEESNIKYNSNINEELEIKHCITHYTTYCCLALILGAYINVKSLVKFGSM